MPLESSFECNIVPDQGSDINIRDMPDLLTDIDDIGYRFGPDEIRLANKYVGGGISVEPSDMSPYSYRYDLINIGFHCDYIVPHGTRLSVDDILDVIIELYLGMNPRYIFGMHDWQLDNIDQYIPSPISDEGLADNRIDYPTWLMVFPPAMVDTYGREWLLDLPADRIDELDDGAIMIVVTEEFTDCESDLEIAKTIDDAMGPVADAFEDAGFI